MAQAGPCRCPAFGRGCCSGWPHTDTHDQQHHMPTACSSCAGSRRACRLRLPALSLAVNLPPQTLPAALPLLCTPCCLQASRCFVLDLDQRAFLAAVKDRQAAGLAPVPATPHADPAADGSSRASSGPIVVDPATYFGSSTSTGFSNSSWPVGQHVLDFFWGELTLSEGAPFECLTPDGKSTVSIGPTLWPRMLAALQEVSR